ncbi:MAG: PASTA domain-containing protein [Acidobacteriota bacterium]
MIRWLLRAVRTTLYIGLIGALFALVSYIAFSQFVRRGVTRVPELYGMAEGDAARLLTDQGLQLALADAAERRFDETVPIGHVVVQRPSAGTLVKRGAAVTAVLSRGPQRIAVPSVVDQAMQAAQVTLAAAGLAVGRTVEIFAPAKSGTVVAQQPSAGTPMERGAPVDLFLSRRDWSRTYLMPDLIGKRYDDVRQFFENRDFRFGRISYRSYAGIPPGTVLEQYPLPGDPLRQGDVLSLSIVAPDEADGDSAEDAP